MGWVAYLAGQKWSEHVKARSKVQQIGMIEANVVIGKGKIYWSIYRILNAISGK